MWFSHEELETITNAVNPVAAITTMIPQFGPAIASALKFQTLIIKYISDNNVMKCAVINLPIVYPQAILVTSFFPKSPDQEMIQAIGNNQVALSESDKAIQ